MAEPARKPSREVGFMQPSEVEDTFPEGVALLERWVEGPDGEMEQILRPLTPEDFLNPLYGDKWVQGYDHSEQTHDLTEMVKRHLSGDPDVVVTTDVQCLFKDRRYKPAPDVTVIRGVRPEDFDEPPGSIDLRKLGVVPSLLIEVVSPRDRRIREVDETRKVRFYERMGVPEYILVWPPPKRGRQMQLWGYRLDRSGRYHRLEPEGQGRILSETTGLWFAVSPDGKRVDLFDARTGEKLLRPLEIVAAREAAEQKALQEAEAREAAEKKAAETEQELARLRAEIARLKTSSGT